MEERRYPPLYCDPAFVLAVIYTLGFFTVFIILLFVSIPASNEDVVKQIMPILSAIQLGIVQYFYNKAQQQSRERVDSTVEKLATAAATTAQVAAAANPVTTTTTSTTAPLNNGKNGVIPNV